MLNSTITTALARSCFAKRLSILFVAMSVGSLLVSAANLHAQSTFTWDGGGTNGNWSGATNWSGDVAPTSDSTNALVFAGTSRSANTNNVSNLTLNSLLFQSGATNFFLRGNAVTLIGGITNTSGRTQNISFSAITNNTTNTINTASVIELNSSVVGTGGIIKSGISELRLLANNSYAGDTTISAGTVQVGNGGTSGTLGTGVVINNGALIFNRSGTITQSGAISGNGSLTKRGAGTLILSGANTYTGSTTITNGILNLNSITGQALGSTSGLTVWSGASLLLSQDNQVNDAAAVTLSGGTIARGGNVSEVFGNLNLTTSSFLDYGGANNAGTIRFGTYTPSALLTVNNFLPGNKLQFGNTISDTDLNNAALFSFSSPWTTSTEGGFFTITAIPEPSTVLAAAGLLGLMLLPSRRRIIRDAKKILGLRARLAAQRES